MCIDIEVSSPSHGSTWVRISHKVTQWTRQSPDFAPQIEGKDTVRILDGIVVGWLDVLDLRIGSPVAFYLEITPPPSDRLHSLIAFQSPSVLGKDTSKPREIHVGERDVDMLLAAAKELRTSPT